MNRRLPDLGPDERRLIINCARLEPDSPMHGQTEEVLRRPLAWDALLLFAELHSVAPLLHHHLKQFDGSGLIPSEARRRLLQLSHRAGYQNRQFSQAFQDVWDGFAEAQIPVVVLKGLSLAELIYGNLGLRPLIDLNLLIPRERLETAKGLLSRMGYVDRTRYPVQRLYRWMYSQVSLVRPVDFEVRLLLQWDVLNRPRIHAIDLRRFWDDAVPARISERDALIPSPVDLVLYLCLQPEKQGFLNSSASQVVDPREFVFAEWTNNRLIRFTDIYEVITHYRDAIDWPVLIERATTSSIEGAVYSSFYWVTKLFGPAIELWVLESLRPPSPRRLRKWLFEALAQQPEGPSSNAGAKALFGAWWLRSQKRSQLRLIDLLELFEFVFPRREEIKLHYRLHTEKAALAFSLFHAGKSLLRCVIGFLPWIYCVLTGGRPSAALRRAATSQGASRL